ncbi:MAG: hypothetical protein Q8O86_13825 [Dehalococcoidia bacterium]|nr:hypothetical protein [Dehalococcoidia bacterium]
MSGTKEASAIKVKVGVSLGDLVSALRKLSEEDREFFIENLLAATSPAYLRSIQEAREDYRQGRTVPWEEAFQEAASPE